MVPFERGTYHCWHYSTEIDLMTQTMTLLVFTHINIGQCSIDYFLQAYLQAWDVLITVMSDH